MHVTPCWRVQALIESNEPLIHSTNRIELNSTRFNRALHRDDPGRWGVGAFVEYQSTVLFVREGSTWLLPGGRLEPAESFAGGAAREVYEETGIEITVTDMVAIAEQTFINSETDESFEFTFVTMFGRPVNTPPNSHWVSDERVDQVIWRDSLPNNTFDAELVGALMEALL